MGEKTKGRVAGIKRAGGPPFLSSEVRDSEMGVPIIRLSWFGGMGSFNDLTISKINGHDVTEEEEDNLNAELQLLRETIHGEATKLLSKKY